MALPAQPPPSPPSAELPRVDERLIAPHQRYEVVGGRLVYSPPADEPHGHQHWKLPSVLGLLLAEGYEGAIDMLTRTSAESDFAPDASVYPSARDKDGGRKLEEIAFEIVGEQRWAVATEKAKRLQERGVRRVFAIHVLQGEVFEWEGPAGRWRTLREDEVIADRCFKVAVPVVALLDRARADEVLVEAVLSRDGHPKVEAAKQAWRAKGLDEGRKQGLDEGRKQGLDEGRKQGLDEGRKQGLDEGRKQGLDEGRKQLLRVLGKQAERRLGRGLGESELAKLEALLDELGDEAAGELVLELPIHALARRLGS